MVPLFALFGCCGPRKKTEKRLTETTPLLDEPADSVRPVVSPEPLRNPQEELAAKWAAIAGTGERTLSSLNPQLIRSPSLRSQSLHSEETSISGASPLPPRESLALPSVAVEGDDLRSHSSLHPDNTSLPPLSPPSSMHTPGAKSSKKKKSSAKFKQAPTEWA